MTALAHLQGDGIVSSSSHWTAELQEQGIPVMPLAIGHFRVVRAKAGAEVIGRVVRERQRRWTVEEVAEARQALLGS